MKTLNTYKFISILLLSNLIFSTIGSHLLYKIIEKKVKTEIKSKILSGEFTKQYKTKILTYNEFLNLNWENHKEFIINKNIYDVVNIEFNLDNIKITYFLDVKESKLRQNYFTFLSSYLNKNKESKNLLFNFIEIILAKYVLNKFNFKLIFDYNTLKYIKINYILNSIYLEIPNPPPQFNS